MSGASHRKTGLKRTCGKQSAPLMISGVLRRLCSTDRFLTWEVAVVAAVLGTAAYMRFVHLETTPIGSDQAWLLDAALDVVRGRRFPPVANSSSLGPVHPPLPIYLYALSLLVNRRLVSAAYLTAALNWASIGLGYIFTRCFFGRVAALIFLPLYALNPWAVHFSRLIWNPTSLPFFSIVALALFTLHFAESRSSPILIGASLALACMFQLHLVSLSLALPVMISGLFLFRRLRLWPTLVCVLLVIASFVPYLASEYGNLRSFLSAMGSRSVVSSAVALIVSDLVSGRGILIAPRGLPRVQPLLRGWLWLSVAVLGLLSVKDLKRVWQGSATPNQIARFILWFWIIVPILTFVRHRHYLQHHYFLFLFPALQIAMAVFVEEVWRAWRKMISSKRVWQVVGVVCITAVLATVAGWSCFAAYTVLSQEATQSCPQEQHMQRVINRIQTLLRQESVGDLVVLSDAVDANSSTLALLKQYVSPDIHMRFTLLGNGLSLPSRPALYLVAGEETRTQRALKQLGVSVGEVDVGPCGTWRFYRTVGGFRPSRSVSLGEWQNDVTLWEYELERDLTSSGDLQLTTVWRVSSNQTGQWYHFFFHLMSSGGDLISQWDGPGVSSPYWREGDWLIVFATLPLPEELPGEKYILYAGLYSWPTLERVPITAGPAEDNRLLLTVVEAAASR